VWQPRFWEHVIRDESDLQRHLDYIHYNPVKHGLVSRPIDWKFSSIRKYTKLGLYEAGWGAAEPENIAGLELE
jgi:putative transposase